MFSSTLPVNLKSKKVLVTTLKKRKSNMSKYQSVIRWFSSRKHFFSFACHLIESFTITSHLMFQRKRKSFQDFCIESKSVIMTHLTVPHQHEIDFGLLHRESNVSSYQRVSSFFLLRIDWAHNEWPWGSNWNLSHCVLSIGSERIDEDFFFFKLKNMF